jgi:acetyl-CoA C-acetyltransferase
VEEPLLEAVVLSAVRTPIGAFGGALKDVSAPKLGAAAARAAIERAGIEPADLDDVILGCVLQAGAGMNVARQAAVAAGVPYEVPAETINRVCGSGLQAVVHAAEAIRGGYAHLVLAGGTESMSEAPYILDGMRWGVRMGHAEARDTMIADGLTCALAGCHMGVTAEEVAARFEVSRADQDAFAVESQRRAAQAAASGAFAAELVPVPVQPARGPATRVEADEHIRPATIETLGGLRTAFKPAGTVTAGNASGINDGAAALVIASADRARALGRQPLATIRSFATVGVDPIIMGMGPVAAIQRAVERAGLSLDDIDLFEINEAFAAQSVAVIRELGLDPSRVNVNGGAIALGHPIGASGARILTTLIYALRARARRLGVAALCIGGGQGIAAVVEIH